jgi:hypothetical protein
VEKYGRDRQATDGNIMQRTRFACWITKAADIDAEYVILIALPRQKWLSERAPVLCFYYIACPVYVYINISNNHGYTNPNTATNKATALLAFFILFQQCGRVLLAYRKRRSVKMLRSNILSSSSTEKFF